MRQHLNKDAFSAALARLCPELEAKVRAAVAPRVAEAFLHGFLFSRYAAAPEAFARACSVADGDFPRFARLAAGVHHELLFGAGAPDVSGSYVRVWPALEAHLARPFSGVPDGRGFFPLRAFPLFSAYGRGGGATELSAVVGAYGFAADVQDGRRAACVRFEYGGSAVAQGFAYFGAGETLISGIQHLPGAGPYLLSHGYSRMALRVLLAASGRLGNARALGFSDAAHPCRGHSVNAGFVPVYDSLFSAAGFALRDGYWEAENPASPKIRFGPVGGRLDECGEALADLAAGVASPWGTV